MNKQLFERVDTLWQNRAELALTGEQLRVLERHWKSFIRTGAQLNDTDQARLAAISEELAGLGAQFSQNVLADEKSWFMELSNQDDLKGLPPFLLDAMAGAARERGLDSLMSLHFHGP